MTQKYDDLDAERLENNIATINSSSLREQVESLPDSRAQHYAVTRHRDTDVDNSTVADECRRIHDYLRFLQSREESLVTVSEGHLSDYFEQRDNFGLGPDRRGQYRRTLRRLHAHLWRAFDVTSVRPSAFSTENLAPEMKTTPYANIQPAEVRRLARSARSRRDELMILLTHQAVLRVGTTTSLRQSDFDSRHGCLIVEYNGRLRRVPLMQELVEDLERWITEEHPAAPAGDEPLFPNRYGNHLQSERTMWTVVTEAAERAGIQTYRNRRNGRTERRLTGQSLRLGGIDHWRASGVPEHLCERFTTGKSKPEFDDEPTQQELSAFETFRGNYHP